jgi:hypothetical protein
MLDFKEPHERVWVVANPTAWVYPETTLPLVLIREELLLNPKTDK